MSVSLGFISYTISVLKSILPVDTGTSGGNLSGGNLPGELPLTSNTENQLTSNTENQLVEIITQATNKLLEKSDSNFDDINAVLSPILVPENKDDELTKTLKNSANVATAEIKKLDQKPIEEYEDVLVTEYFLKHYYGQEDYTKFKQKIEKIEFKEQSNKDFDKEKIQKELLEREKFDFQKAEFEKINLKAIRDFQERINSDRLKENKKV